MLYYLLMYICICNTYYVYMLTDRTVTCMRPSYRTI